jgi:hypothetical protein
MMSKERKAIVVKRLAVGTIVMGLAAVVSGPAGASPSPAASCAAILTSFEATQLPPGFVGGEVSGLAGPGFGPVIRDLAGSHLGTLEDCAAIAP